MRDQGRSPQEANPIFEAGLDDLVGTNVKARLVSSVSTTRSPMRHIVFIAVGTPSTPMAAPTSTTSSRRGGRPSDRRAGAPFASRHQVDRAGRTAGSRCIAGKHLSTDRFAVASNPEFLREGDAIRDFMEPTDHRRSPPSGRASSWSSSTCRSPARPAADCHRTVETAELINIGNAFSRPRSPSSTSCRGSARRPAPTSPSSARIGLDRALAPASSILVPASALCFPRIFGADQDRQ